MMRPRGLQTMRGWVLSGLALAGSCYAPQSERLTCDDVDGAEAVDFGTIQALVRDGNKGCLGGPCHSGETQPAGLRLDTNDLVYEEFSTRSAQLYTILASEQMPDGGTPWSDEDLKAFRTWYCNGAFPP